MQDQIHYELFVRRRVNSGWSLELADEDRAKVIEAAEELLAARKVAAVKVTKEILDPETRAFRSAVVLSKGEVLAAKARRVREREDAPLCVGPSDLYSVHARERIGRLFEGWLTRKRATPFELLHRPDLVEQLDASGSEIQHAIQRIAIPEAQARDVSVHEVMRSFQGLAERAVERLLRDGRRRAFPSVEEAADFKALANDLGEDAERAYRLGGAVAGYLARAETWREKIDLILELAEQAPEAGRGRALAMHVLEQPLAEILRSRLGLADLLGPGLDLGGSLAALTRLAAPKEIESLMGFDPSLRGLIPPLPPETQRLSTWLQAPEFASLRGALARRVVTELIGSRRLRPGDPDGEIAILRALAMALTACAGQLIPREDVAAAFVTRSKRLVTPDFVEDLLGRRESALEEVEALIKLAENVAGKMNKREAARWIAAAVGALRFEKEARGGADLPQARLAALARLQKAVREAGDADDPDLQSAVNKIGDIGGLVEADSKLIAAIGRADAGGLPKLTALLRLASGEAAPLGPAADRARAEAMKLARAPDIREEVGRRPEQVEQIRALIQSATLAA